MARKPENRDDFRVKLKLSADTQSTMISKKGISTKTQRQMDFVVKNNKAEKRNISLGRENPLYYEVTSGLKQGESVITSDYSELENTKF